MTQGAATSQDLLQALAAHVDACTLASMPADAVAATRRFVLDTIVVGWAGSGTTIVQDIARGLVPDGSAGPCDLWGLDRRAAPMDAAFVNGVAAAVLEFDSLHAEGLVHADIVTIPAVLAVAQSVRASGADFLAAVAVANDVACRLALAADAHSGWWHTSLYGVFGAAAGCARLLGLKAPGIAEAMGLALGGAGGTQQAIVEKSTLKCLQSAIAARAGAFAAYLAHWGASGPSGALTGQYGLYGLYEPGRIERALDGLGQRFEGTLASMKKFPTCGCNHAAIEAALRLRGRVGGDRARIVDVVARISPYMNRLVGAPYAPEQNPRVAAQFSAQYGVARALLDGRVGLSELEPEAALDAEAVRLARRVRIEIDEGNAGQLVPAEVEIALDDGTVLRQRTDALPGGPDDPLGLDDLTRKARDCLQRGAVRLSEREVDSFIARVGALESLPTLDGLLPRLSQRSPSP